MTKAEVPTRPEVVRQDTLEGDGGVAVSYRVSGPGNGWPALKEVFASSSHHFVNVAMMQLEPLLRVGGEGAAPADALSFAVAAVAAIAPSDELEAMMAVQMVGAHVVAMDTLARSAAAATVDARGAYVTMATKLSRTFAAQMEALARKRAAGKQVIEVQHVHVYPGGQAVVGNITGGGGHLGNDQQSHALPLVAAVWGEDEGGHALRGAGDAREGQVQDARRPSGRADRAAKRRLSARASDAGDAGGPAAGKGGAPAVDRD